MTPLHHIGNLVRDLLLLVPLPAVRGLFVAVPVLLLIWVMTLPKQEMNSPDDTERLDANLKVGAAVALVMQIVIYSLL